MKDKEFEQLLQDSIRTHGREYLSDDDRHHIPILPHTFPDDFLSDVLLPSQQPKKPALRVIRILSACAAVLVLVTVLTVVPAILNSRKTVDTQIAVPSASSVPTDHAPTNNAGHASASDDSVSSVRSLPDTKTAEAVRPSENPAKSTDSYSEQHSSDREYHPVWEEQAEHTPSAVPSETSADMPSYSSSVIAVDIPSEVPAEEPTAEPSLTPAEEPLSEPTAEPSDFPEVSFVLPEQVSAVLLYGQTSVALSRTDANALAMVIADGMKPAYQQSEVILPALSETQISVTLSSQEPMFLYGNDYQKLTALMTEQALYIIAECYGETTCYYLPDSNTYYGTFRSMVRTMAGTEQP